MLTLAVATLALAGAPATKHVQGQNYLLPLYDLVTNETGSGSSYVTTATFSLSNNWNSGVNSTSNFHVYYALGASTQFTPDSSPATWNDITSYGTWNISGNVATFTITWGIYVTGTMWVQYNGGPNDSIYGSEVSFVAAQFGQNQGVGHGSRPGTFVPITKPTPESDSQGNGITVLFNLYQPFGGAWGNSAPQYWECHGNNASMAPNGSWVSMPNVSPTSSNGGRQVSSIIHPNSSNGYYCIAIQETYTPSESYNTHNSPWTEFSGVIRPYSH